MRAVLAGSWWDAWGHVLPAPDAAPEGRPGGPPGGNAGVSPGPGVGGLEGHGVGTLESLGWKEVHLGEPLGARPVETVPQGLHVSSSPQKLEACPPPSAVSSNMEAPSLCPTPNEGLRSQSPCPSPRMRAWGLSLPPPP